MKLILSILLLSFAFITQAQAQNYPVGTKVKWKYVYDTSILEGFKLYYGPKDNMTNVIDLPDPEILFHQESGDYIYFAKGNPDLNDKLYCFQLSAYKIVDGVKIESSKSGYNCGVVSALMQSPNDVRLGN